MTERSEWVSNLERNAREKRLRDQPERCPRLLSEYVDGIESSARCTLAVDHRGHHQYEVLKPIVMPREEGDDDA